MKKLSGFDLGMIIAAAVVAILGGGGWYYLSGQLEATQQDVTNASSDFEKYSSREVYLPTAANEKTLQSDIDLMQAQLDPLVRDHLQAPGNKLSTVVKEDTVAWKHDLDTEVSGLNTAAKLHGVTVPNNFYYGFSRYLNTNPGEEQTVVLSKQLLGVEQIATIFIDAPVKAISTFRRTYEEDQPSSTPNYYNPKADPDLLPGTAEGAPGDVYTAYPFEIQFETTTDAFRKVVDGLQKSPYVFVIRSMIVHNSAPTSPQISDLDKMAGPPPDVATDTTPGGVDAAKSTKGPQFLFGGETLQVKIRIDMIEWKGVATGSATAPTGRSRNSQRSGNGAHAASSGNASAGNASPGENR